MYTEKGSELTESPKAIKNRVDERSWLRDTPHYWAEASLPLAYAVACVEVVCKHSEKARAIYSRAVETWSAPGMKAVFDDIGSTIPESEKRKIKEALLNPETELLPDPNRPFKELEAMFAGLEVNEEFFKGHEIGELSWEERQEAEEVASLIWLVMEFVRVGFNRESDIQKGRYRVEVSEKAPWLLWAVAIRSLLDSCEIRFEQIRDFYKIRGYKGRVIDFYKVLSEQPMSRLHREMIASAKAADLRLKNDKTIVKAAQHWYQCRVVFRSINKYCAVFENYQLEPKNISKQIRPCDEALGYVRRLPRRKGK